MINLKHRQIISLCLSLFLLTGGQLRALGRERDDVHKWLAALHNKQESARLNVAYNFKLLEPITKDTIAVLVQALKDEDPFVRSHVAGAIGEFGKEPEIAVPALIQALYDEEPLVREQATIALGKLGPYSIPLLINLLSKEEIRVDSKTKAGEQPEGTTITKDIRLSDYAALAIKHIGPHAFPALIEALKVPPMDSELAKRGVSRQDGIEGIIRGVRFGSADSPKKRYAEYLLKNIALPSAQAVDAIQKSADRDVRKWSIVAVGNNAEDPQIVIPTLIKVLDGDDSELSTLAVRALAGYGRQAAPTVISALRHKDDNVRYTAIHVLEDMLEDMELDNSTLVPALILALNDEEWMVRTGAARAIRRLGPAASNAVPALIKVLQSPADWMPREEAVEALGVIGNDTPPVITALSKALRDEDDDVKQAAARSLAQIGPPARAAIPILLAVRHKGREYSLLRFYVADALLAIDKNDSRIKSKLIKDLSSPNEDVALIAFRMLGEIVKDDSTLITFLAKARRHKSSFVRNEAIKGLGDIGVKALPYLAAALKDSEEYVRFSALMEIEKIKVADPKVKIFILLDTLKDRSAHVRRQAAEMLGDLGPTAKVAISSLIKMLNDTDKEVRESVVTALGKFGKDAAPAITHLSDLLNDNSLHVSLAAAVALLKLDANTTSAVQTITEALGVKRRENYDSAPEIVSRASRENRELIFPIVMKALKSTNSAIREGAATILADDEHLPKEAIPVLVSTLEDKNANVRLSVLKALIRAKLDTHIIEPLLIKALDDNNPVIRITAAETLLGNGHDVTSVLPKLNTIIYDKFTHEYVTESVQEIGEEVRPPSIAYALNEDRLVRLPQLPWWPPPRFSGWYVLPEQTLGTDRSNMGDAYRRVSQALSELSYRSTGLFTVPDGFAVVPGVERIYEDGKWYPAPERWTNNKLTPRTWSDYWARLWVEPPGHYRLFMFIVTRQKNLQGNDQELAEQQARELFSRGGKILPDSIANVLFSNHYCHIIVYHFQKKNGETKILYVDPLDAETHLKQSGLWNRLSSSH